MAENRITSSSLQLQYPSLEDNIDGIPSSSESTDHTGTAVHEIFTVKLTPTIKKYKSAKIGSSLVLPPVEITCADQVSFEEKIWTLHRTHLQRKAVVTIDGDGNTGFKRNLDRLHAARRFFGGNRPGIDAFRHR